MTVSAVVVNWNSDKLLRICMESLRATSPDVEVIVVDNASTDSSLSSLGDFHAHVDMIRNSVNRGFAAAVNQGFAAKSTPFVLLLNPDVRVLPGAVALLRDVLSAHPKAGAVGGYVNDHYLPRQLPTPGRIVHENLGLSSHQEYANASGIVRVEQPAAAALMVRRDAYDEIGGLDERFYPAWYEDVDFCQRLKTAGWEVYFARNAEFEHEGGYSADALGTKAFAVAYYRNQLRYAQKHFGFAGRLAVRTSIVGGTLARMVSRPGQAAAYLNVLRGALGAW